MSEEYIDNLKERAKLFGEEREEMIQEAVERDQIQRELRGFRAEMKEAEVPALRSGNSRVRTKPLNERPPNTGANWKKLADEFEMEPTLMEKLNEHIDINTAYIVLFFFIGLALGVWL